MSPTRPLLVAVVGPTATGKSALGIALAQRFDGEIVSCDSTAVYRGFDIGTDKVPEAEREGIPHHVIDVVAPDESYSAARYAEAATSAIRGITARGKIPILVGGSGLYYRALTRGLFPGPGRDVALRARLGRIATRRGVETLYRMVGRVDPASAVRIQPRDERRLVRALEVYRLTGRTLTEHFAATRSPIHDYEVASLGLHLPRDTVAARVATRVDRQFVSGLLDEVQGLLSSGVLETMPPFGGLVYRQVLEHIRGVRDEAATRELIVQENRRYARRQLIWFRKEPNLRWLQVAGEHPDALALAVAALPARLVAAPAPSESGTLVRTD